MPGGSCSGSCWRIPRSNVTQITSETYARQYAHFVHPNLRGHTDQRFKKLDDLESCDLLFLALPHTQAMDRIEALAAKAERIVDLSADFRLRTAADYEKWYGGEHPAPEWLERFVYGMPELYREELAGARYASGTGCNAIVTMLALCRSTVAAWCARRWSRSRSAPRRGGTSRARPRITPSGPEWCAPTRLSATATRQS